MDKQHGPILSFFGFPNLERTKTQTDGAYGRRVPKNSNINEKKEAISTRSTSNQRSPSRDQVVADSAKETHGNILYLARNNAPANCTFNHPSIYCYLVML